jgi:type IV secretion system protein VirB4
MGFPSITCPGILDDLNRLAIPYRWCIRAIALDKTDAVRVLTRIRRQWFAKRKSVGTLVKEAMTNESSALVDSDAHNKALDADAALQELGSDLIAYAYVTATVTVFDENAHVADERLRLVEKVIQGRDFTCIAETVNAIEAWLGSLPGHVYGNVRQPLVSTLNLAHVMPLSAVWAGPDRNDHLDGPPLLFAKTEGATPFRLSLHVGDVGHTLVVGPTGAGKSVLLALMALQFRRYEGARISPSTSAVRSEPRRSPWVATGTTSAGRCQVRPSHRSRCSRSMRSTMPPSGHGQPNGWRRSLLARA